MYMMSGAPFELDDELRVYDRRGEEVKVHSHCHCHGNMRSVRCWETERAGLNISLHLTRLLIIRPEKHSHFNGEPWGSGHTGGIVSARGWEGLGQI